MAGFRLTGSTSTGALHLYGGDPDQYLTGGTTNDQTEYVVQWLENHSDGPFFLWAHYFDPHWPFAPPAEFLPEGVEPPAGHDYRILDAPNVRSGLRALIPAEQSWLRTLYSAEVRHVDRAIGRIVDKLVELGIYDDSLIVFTSDHGEEFWEHRRYGHGHAIYPEVLRVPFMVKRPGPASGRTVEAAVPTGALTPTLLELAEVPYVAEKGWTSSLASLVRGETEDFPYPIFSSAEVPYVAGEWTSSLGVLGWTSSPGGFWSAAEPRTLLPNPISSSAVRCFENQESVVFNGMQLIRHIDTAGVELYDLNADPAASISLAESRPEVVKHGETLLDEHLREAVEIRRSLGLSNETGEKWDNETLQRLRDLGYLLAPAFPDEDKAIKNGAQLIVRESQTVQLVYVGEFGDQFGPGKHTLSTENIPILTRLKSWKYGLESPFKVDVYYINTRLFTGVKWGTSNPIMMRDDDFGIVRARAFGTFDFKIIEPKTFLKEVAGSDHTFRMDEFSDTMRSRLVSVFSEALATSNIPVLDVATKYSELGQALLPLINPVVGAKYGISFDSFIVENISLPKEVEEAIDKRSSMAAVGNLNDYVKFQMAEGMGQGEGGGAGGMATEMAIGMAMAQQMMQQQGGLFSQQTPAAAPVPAAPAATGLPELLNPAQVAQALGVTEADVMAIVDSGDLPAKKIGASVRIKRSALDEYLAD